MTRVADLRGAKLRRAVLIGAEGRASAITNSVTAEMNPSRKLEAERLACEWMEKHGK